jgi:anti-anti-sigma regulatory factor
MQRENDKAAFDRLSMQYVAQFESSAPAWEEKGKPENAPKTPGGYVVISGSLTAASAKQLDGLKRAIARRADATRLDLAAVQGFDDEGARLLADTLGEARRARIGLQMQASEGLVSALNAALKNGREAGEGAWLLALELMQWANDSAAFEDRAVEFAVTFELSPPSWEPPEAAAAAPKSEATEAPSNGNADPEMLQWSGVLAGSEPQIARLTDSAHDRSVVAVDLSEVERIDFVCANALVNAVSRVESQHKSVQMIGVSPIIRALLLLLGVPPRVFVKKTP